MVIYKSIMLSYCKALLENDSHAMIDLFSKDARVSSFFVGEKSPQEFFQNLFATSRRTKVEIKSIFVGLDNKKTIAANLYIDAVWNEKFSLQFEAVDLFTFDSENKILMLKIILDTYPLRKLKAEAGIP